MEEGAGGEEDRALHQAHYLTTAALHIWNYNYYSSGLSSMAFRGSLIPLRWVYVDSTCLLQVPVVTAADTNSLDCLDSYTAFIHKQMVKGLFVVI